MSLNDPRVQFYLRHREQFAEWFELRTDAATAVDDWLLTLRPEFETLARDCGEDVDIVAEAEDSAWPGLFLRRRWWPRELNNTPSVGLQWARRKTLLTPDAAPWVGVRGDRKVGTNRHVFESAGFQASRRARSDSATQWWPALRYLLPEAPFPEAAEAFRELIVKSVRESWNAYAPSIDEAMVTLPDVIRPTGPLTS